MKHISSRPRFIFFVLSYGLFLLTIKALIPFVNLPWKNMILPSLSMIYAILLFFFIFSSSYYVRKKTLKIIKEDILKHFKKDDEIKINQLVTNIHNEIIDSHCEREIEWPFVRVNIQTYQKNFKKSLSEKIPKRWQKEARKILKELE